MPDCLNSSVFSFSNVADDSELVGKSFTSFSEFQIFVPALLNALDENWVRAARGSRRLKEEEHTGL